MLSGADGLIVLSFGIGDSCVDKLHRGETPHASPAPIIAGSLDSSPRLQLRNVVRSTTAGQDFRCGHGVIAGVPIMLSDRSPISRTMPHLRNSASSPRRQCNVGISYRSGFSYQKTPRSWTSSHVMRSKSPSPSRSSISIRSNFLPNWSLIA